VIVVDASAAIEALLRTPAAEAVAARLFGVDQTLHAPDLIDVEVTHVLRRYAAMGAVAAERCRAALLAWMDFPLRRHPHDILLHRMWELRGNLTAYDAAYVALAETLDAPLVTRDRRLAAVTGHRARIELV
jgi:predicted nucleic acid-binding protein